MDIFRSLSYYIYNIYCRTIFKGKEMPKTKAKKAKKVTMTEAKAEAARLGLDVSPKYDKRYLNTWLFTIGQDVAPIERQQIVHVPRAKKQPLTMAELIALAKGNNNAT